MNNTEKGEEYNKSKSTSSQSKGKKDLNNNTAFYRKMKNDHDALQWKNIQNTLVYLLVFTPTEPQTA